MHITTSLPPLPSPRSPLSPSGLANPRIFGQFRFGAGSRETHSFDFFASRRLSQNPRGQRQSHRRPNGRRIREKSHQPLQKYRQPGYRELGISAHFGLVCVTVRKRRRAACNACNARARARIASSQSRVHMKPSSSPQVATSPASSSTSVRAARLAASFLTRRYLGRRRSCRRRVVGCCRRRRRRNADGSSSLCHPSSIAGGC